MTLWFASETFTADELVVEDPAGVKETFSRVKPEKKKEK